MAYDKDGNTAAFCQTQENARGLPHLGNASRRSRNLLTVHGLNGINNHNFRLQMQYIFLHISQIRLTQKQKGILERADALGTHLDLPQGFLSRHIEHLFPAFRQQPAHLEKEGGLPNARISAYQNQ